MKKAFDPMKGRVAVVSDAALLERAKRAYYRRFGQDAAIPAASSYVLPPDLVDKVKQKQIVVLQNVRGILAVYHYRPWLDSLRYFDHPNNRLPELGN